ncbi:MAG: rRNA pseudouridine synthase [Deltaproteobacteria bacterium]|nr:rRNA pseudouridine synthase [Deltaproteobacteria bacterium]MBW2016776.1 rRNA pseudouridine synthase [Deltaproteobacteria bacterium]MBW2304197.1 rRNA pseudouridine synthase [Deltaproteobacteria bacterium]
MEGRHREARRKTSRGAKPEKASQPKPAEWTPIKSPPGDDRTFLVPQRVNRILSLAGVSSRRKADALISEGRVTVNGRVVSGPGAKALWGVDRIKVDGQEIPGPSPRIYLMLNKPFGYLCSFSDPEGRPVVTDLLENVPQRVYSVGRLDFDTLGLLLLTDDGDWAHRLAHPRFRVPKTYKVTVNGSIPEAILERLRKGVYLDDGFSGTAKVARLGEEKGKSLVRITVTSGRRRLIRRMFEAVGFRVVHLIRTGYGVLELGDLKIGEYRHLETHEVDAMKKMVGLK